jgi:hypothetical protein
MAHRSNQAVASQERELTQPPNDPPPPRRLIAGWSMALGALGISLLLLAAGLWLVRFSIASFMLGAALSERGADADFQFINLDLNSAALANVRFGSEDRPGRDHPPGRGALALERGLSPHVYFLRVVRPRLHLRMDEGGRVSAGSLEHLGGGAPGPAPSLSIPAIELEILEGQALIDSAVRGAHRDAAKLGHSGPRTSRRLARSPAPRARAATYALEAGAAELVVISRDNTISFRLSASANA